MKIEQAHAEYLTVKQIVQELGHLIPGKTPETQSQKVYGHVKKGHLKGIKGRFAQLDGSVRLTTVAHRNDVERYEAWLKRVQKEYIDMTPTPPMTALVDAKTVNVLRSIAVYTLGQYLSTLPSAEREDTGLAVVVEAI